MIGAPDGMVERSLGQSDVEADTRRVAAKELNEEAGVTLREGVEFCRYCLRVHVGVSVGDVSVAVRKSCNSRETVGHHRCRVTTCDTRGKQTHDGSLAQ